MTSEDADRLISAINKQTEVLSAISESLKKLSTPISTFTVQTNPAAIGTPSAPILGESKA